MMVILPRRLSERSSTVPEISARTAGSLGLRASKISVTRGRPPVMSCVPATFARLAGEHLAGVDLLAVGHLDARLGGQVVEVEDLAVRVFDDDPRMVLALVLDDDELAARRAAFALFLEADGFALFDVLVADDAGLLGQDRREVRVPDDQLLARLDLLAVADHDRRAVGHLVLLELAALGVDDGDFAVALERDADACCLRHRSLRRH